MMSPPTTIPPHGTALCPRTMMLSPAITSLRGTTRHLMTMMFLPAIMLSHGSGPRTTIPLPTAIPARGACGHMRFLAVGH